MTVAQPSEKGAISSATRRAKRSRARWLVALLAIAAAASGGYGLWLAVREHVLADPQYRVTAQTVTITPLPAWIRNDFKDEVVRDAELAGPLSILDEDLAEKLYEAFEAHPWVAKVERVMKRPPANVEVEVVYRRPVLMVHVPLGLLPVDEEGVQLLTVDFSPLEAIRYPRLVDVGAATAPPAGSRWGDPRVLAAARLAACLIDAWEELGLHHMSVSAESSPGGGKFAFELFTEQGSRVLWGYAPGISAEDMKATTDKLTRLRHYHAERGTLDGSRGPQDLDLRDGRELHSTPRTAMSETNSSG